jgi:hypothetical protein
MPYDLFAEVNPWKQTLLSALKNFGCQIFHVQFVAAGEKGRGKNQAVTLSQMF